MVLGLGENRLITTSSDDVSLKISQRVQDDYKIYRAPEIIGSSQGAKFDCLWWVEREPLGSSAGDREVANAVLDCLNGAFDYLSGRSILGMILNRIVRRVDCGM